MPRLSFSESDILATTQLEGGWYTLEVKAISDWTKGSRDPESNNLIGDFVVQGPKKAGVPVRHWFSEKNLGTSRDMLVPYLSCFTPDGKIAQGTEYDPVDTVGRKVDAYISWNAEMKMNSIQEFRRFKGAAAPAAATP